MGSQYSLLLLLLLLLFFYFFLYPIISENNTPPPINPLPLEQKALHQILNSLNPTIPCSTNNLSHSPPPLAAAVILDYFPSRQQSYIVELNFTDISCSSNATLNPLLFTSFTYLRKLSFHKCFNNTQKPINLISLPSFPSTLEELVFMDNPSIVSPLYPFLQNLTSLRRLILIGNGFNGEIPSQISHLHNLEELTISGNNLSGEVPTSLGMLKKLKILDLSHNMFKGCVPEQIGNLTSVVKLDLSFNGFSCKIPESFVHLKNLEVLDLSFNLFGNFGIPMFLGEISKLKEIYLSGNSLYGEIPEIWEKLGGVEKIGFSKMGLIGEIPVSMGVYLKNLSYLGLDNNNLYGPVLEVFGLLKFVDEINLENNNFSGTITFSYEVGEKFDLAGNVGLCLVEKYYKCSGNESSSFCQLNSCQTPTNSYETPTTDDRNHRNYMMMMKMILLLLLYGWFCYYLFTILQEEELELEKVDV